MGDSDCGFSFSIPLACCFSSREDVSIISKKLYRNEIIIKLVLINNFIVVSMKHKEIREEIEA